MSSHGLIFILSIILMMTIAPFMTGSIETKTGSFLHDSAGAQELAQAMAMQQSGLLAWARANPGVYGVVPVASLSMPAPWTGASGLTSLVGLVGATPIAVTYYSGTRYLPGALVSALSVISGYGGTTGMTNANGLASASGYATPLPAAVPLGYPAMAQVAH